LSGCDRIIVDKKSEIIKGYPQERKREEDWVIMEQEEIDSCKRDSSDTLRIIQFVTSSEIPEIYFNKPN
jgi:non-homologous end joining protein Ku